VLPLFSLPFSFALGNIRSAAYKAVYGVLLLLSFLTMWGFLFQPQWMYNQPDGKSTLFVNGLSGLLNSLHITFFNSNDVVRFFPSFVVPYFAYFQSRAAGDAAAAAAWRASFWPVVIVFVIVLACLALAWFGKSRGDTSLAGSGPGYGDSDGSGQDSDLQPAKLEPSTTTFLTLISVNGVARVRRAFQTIGHSAEGARGIIGELFSALRAGFQAPFDTRYSLVPQFAYAGPNADRFPRDVYFQVHTPGEPAELTPAEQSENGLLDDHAAPSEGGASINGNERTSSPAAVSEHLEPYDLIGPPAANERSIAVVGAEATSVQDRALVPLRWLWQTRGLWLGIVGIGLALNGQRILTTDKDVVSSIRWYALGIIVTIVGWLGTYKNKIWLVGIPRKPDPKAAAAADTAATRVPEVSAIAAPGQAGVPPMNGSASVEQAVAPLPVRRRVVVAETEGHGDERPQAATTLPVRARGSRVPASAGPPAATTAYMVARPDDGALTATDPGAGSLVPAALPADPSAAAPATQASAGATPAPETLAAPVPRTGLRTAFRQWRSGHPLLGGPWPRYVVAAGALGLNLYAAG